MRYRKGKEAELKFLVTRTCGIEKWESTEKTIMLGKTELREYLKELGNSHKRQLNSLIDKFELIEEILSSTDEVN